MSFARLALLVTLCDGPLAEGFVIPVRSSLIAPVRPAPTAVNMNLRSRVSNLFRRQDAAVEAPVVAVEAAVKAPVPVVAVEAPVKAPVPVAAAEAMEDATDMRQEEAAKTDTGAEASIAPAAEAIKDAVAPLWTLEDRDDGWNDLRAALKDRQKPWEELKQYFKRRPLEDAPAVRWARVLVDEAKSLSKKS